MNNKLPPLSDEQVEALVLRRLHGELAGEAAEQLAAALAADPRLASRAAGLERSWRALELPPVRQESVAPQVLARLRSEVPLALAPFWARLAGAAALVAGLGAGLNLDWGLEPLEATPELVQNGADLYDEAEAGYAESLWFAAETESQDEGEAQ